MGLACSRRSPETTSAEDDDWEVIGEQTEAATSAERTTQRAISLAIDHRRAIVSEPERSSDFWRDYGQNLHRLEREFATLTQIPSYSGSAQTKRAPLGLAYAATLSPPSSSEEEASVETRGTTTGDLLLLFHYFRCWIVQVSQSRRAARQAPDSADIAEAAFAPSSSLGEAVAKGHTVGWPEGNPPRLQRVDYGSDSSPSDWFVRTARSQQRAKESRESALRLIVNPARANWLRARLKVALLQCLRRRWSRAGAWLNLHPVRERPIAERVPVDPALRGRISRTWATCGRFLLPQYRSKELFGHLRGRGTNRSLRTQDLSYASGLPQASTARP